MAGRAADLERANAEVGKVIFSSVSSVVLFFPLSVPCSVEA